MDKPQNLGTRGSNLWDNVTESTDFDAAGYHLLEDACRTADIIDRLTGLLDMDVEDWLRIVDDKGHESDGKKLIVNVHPLLGEIRQQRIAMRQLLNQLGIARSESEGDEQSKQSKEFWAAAEEQFKKG